MSASLDPNQQNLVNKSRKSATNDRTRRLSKEMAVRHRLSDQKWRQNVSKGFAALKTIVKKERQQSLDQIINIDGVKEVVLNNKPNANKRLSRIETLRSTIDVIKSKESVIENLINERQQKLNDVSKNEFPKSDKPLIAFNGLQKIKDIFESFERRHELETKNKEMKTKKTETKTSSSSPTEVGHSLSATDVNKTDPLLLGLNQIKCEEINEIVSEIDFKQLFDCNNNEEVVDEWQPLIIPKTECGTSLDINNNDTNYRSKDYDHSLDQSLDSSHDYCPLLDPIDKSFADYSYSFDPKDFLTTDLSEHLAITLPMTPFSSSLNYLNCTYI